VATLPSSFSDQFMVLGYHIYVMTTQSANVDQTMPIQFGTTLVLLSLTFMLNISAIVLRYRIRKKKTT
jgi:phosphate transport system permease protein